MNSQYIDDSSLLREQLVSACKLLYAVRAAGDGMGGHLSARIAYNRMLIKPRSVSWQQIKTEDFVTIDFEGNNISGDVQSAVREWPIHSQIYLSRPEVRFVLHAHPIASTLMAALGIAIEPLDQDCADFVDELPVLDNKAASICSAEMGNQVVLALGPRRALLLKNHGSVVVGSSIASLGVTAQKLEKVAETMLHAASLTKLPIMSGAARDAVLRSRSAAARPASLDAERWQIMQGDYLGRQNDG